MKKKINILKKAGLFLCFMLLLISGLTACGETIQQEAEGKFATENLSEQESQTETEQATQTEDSAEHKVEENAESEISDIKVEKDGTYTSKEEVAAYLNQYGQLPSNFITKKEAKKLGWVSNEGNLGEVAPGKSIGGDYFGNYEGLLPEKDGRDYYECDINTDGSYRGAERIVFSNDGLIYYTGDHYDSFELLYGED